MATVAGPVKQSSTPKNDAFVETQLDRARRRIRVLDLLTAFLGFLAGTLAFGLVMAILDSWLELSSLARGVGVGLYLVAAAGYLGFSVVVPMSRRINPYYAARKVEETIPDAKNSVVNWLDLHNDTRLPGAIHHAVSQRAARDLAHVDLDQALSGRRAGWAGGAFGLLFVVFLIVLFSLGYRKFFSHLGRAFLPFGSGAAARSTLLTLLEPEGDVTVSADQPVTFRVRVEGKVPPTVQLLTRQTMEDPERPWTMEETPGDHSLWEVTIPGPSVQNGFYYRIVGGDAETETHRVTVRASPTIFQDRFVARYKQRPYIGQKLERVERKQRDLKDLRGTEVRLEVPTNRQLVDGRMDISLADGKKQSEKAVIDANDRTRMHFKFVLEQSGQYLMRFTSVEGEPFSDSLPFKITAQADNAPKVELKKPGQNVAEPADGQVELAGEASDDLGVREVNLRIKVVEKIGDGTMLAAQPYRSEQDIRLADGGYPHVLDYLHTLDLTKLKDSDGRPYPLKAGQELEYWLEAKDACDFPAPNVGESQRFRISITEPKKNQKEKEEQQKKAAEKEQEHKKKQDEKRNEENKQRKEEAEKEKKRQEDEQKQQKNAEGKDPKKNEGEPGKKDENKDPDKKNGGNDPGDKDKQAAEKERKDKEIEEKNKKLNEAAAEQEKKEREEKRGQGKDDPSKEKPGEGKEGDNRPNDKPEPKERQGEGKGAPDDKQQKDKQDRGKEGQQAGKPDEKRGEGKQGKPDKADQPGESKDGKDADGMKDEKAAGKDGAQKQGQHQERGEPKGKPEQHAGKGKEGAQPDQKQGEGKQAGQPEMNDAGKGEKGAEKPGQQAGAEKENKPAAGKEGQADAQKRGDGKPSGQKDAGDRAGEKKEGQQADGMKEQRGQGKEQGPMSDPKQGEGKGEPKKNPAAQGKEGPKDQAAGKGKTGPKPDDKKAQPGEEKGGGGEEKTAEKKDDAIKGQGSKGEDKSAEDARKEDVEKLARDLKSDDAGKRDEARRKLEQISKEGKNGDARQAAENEVEKQNAEDEKKAGDDVKKLVEALKGGDEKKRETAKKALDEIAKQAREAKDDGKGQQPENPKELPKDVKDALEQLQKDAKSDDPQKREGAQQALKALEEAAKQADKKPMEGGNKVTDFIKDYIGGAKARQTNDTAAKANDPKSDNRHRDRAGDLKLDKFSDVVKKKILKDAGLTEKDVKDIRDLVKRRPELKDAPDSTAKRDPGKGLATTRPEQIKTGDGAKDIGANDKGLPPLEYRDAFKEFSKRFSGGQAKDK